MRYASIYYRFRDSRIGPSYWLKIDTLGGAPPLGVKPPDLRKDPWLRKTRMMGLSDGERILMMRSAVLIQYTRVTDGRTDGQTELAWHRLRAIACTVARKNAYIMLPIRRVTATGCLHASSMWATTDRSTVVYRRVLTEYSVVYCLLYNLTRRTPVLYTSPLICPRRRRLPVSSTQTGWLVLV